MKSGSVFRSLTESYVESRADLQNQSQTSAPAEAQSRAERVRSLAYRLQNWEEGRYGRTTLRTNLTDQTEPSQPAGQQVSPLATGISATGISATGISATGISASELFPLDWLLPSGGLPAGALVEWLSKGPGMGATTLALRLIRRVMTASSAGTGFFSDHTAKPVSESRPLMVIDRWGEFYPPALEASGIPLSRVLVARPSDDRQECWALDQALRCRALGSVLCWSPRLDSHRFRRLQLAAEAGETLGLLLRPARCRYEPSWADLRLLVEALPTIQAPNSCESSPPTLDVSRASTRGPRQRPCVSMNGSGGMPRDGFQDSSHQDSSHRDSSHRDSSHQDSSHRDSSHRDSSHQDSSHRDSSHRDSSDWGVFPARNPQISPLVRRWRLTVIRCRGGSLRSTVEVELDGETDTLRLAAPLAASATHLDSPRVWGATGT